MRGGDWHTNGPGRGSMAVTSMYGAARDLSIVAIVDVLPSPETLISY